MKIFKFMLPFLSFVALGNGMSVSGHVHDSFNNIPGANSIVKVYRKPTGPIDTLVTTTNINTRWTIETLNFIPPAQVGDTLYIKAYKDTLGRRFETNTWWVIRNGTYPQHNFVRELHLDDPFSSSLAFTPNISVVKDTSGISTSFIALAMLYKNLQQPCIGVVDTSLSLTHRYDAYFNLEMQDSTFSQGDSFKIRLEKTRNDTTWFTEIASAIDTTYWDAMLVNASNSVHNGAFHGDTLYFPQGFSVFKDIGLEQILVPDSADSGQMIVPGIVIRNYGTINQEPYLHCKINEFYHDSMQVTMPPGIDTFYFAPCSLNSVGNFLVTQYSVLQGDVNPSNDTLRKTIVVNPVGIVEEKLENKVKEGLIIKPNPAKNYVISSQEAVLYDALGRKIKKIDKGKNSINLNSGVYFVKKDEDIEKLVIYK
ncbi:MAG: hypothetical protein QW484_02410 [Candidatus Pacearchaeota archaeon]